MSASQNESIIVYESPDGQVKFDVPFENETVWLAIDQMSTLFKKSRSTINEHILNIFKEKELVREDCIRKIGISDFSTKPTNLYNLDVIISVGYRVKSQRGVQFRRWATQVLKEHLIKGYSINSRKIFELEKKVQEISDHLEKRKPVEEEVIVALKYLLETADPNLKLVSKA